VTHFVQRDAEMYQLYCANVAAIWSHMAGDSLCSNVMLKYINCTVLTCQPYGVTWLVTHFVQRDAEMYQLYCANVAAIWSHMAGDSLCSNVMLKYINCTVLTWQPYGVTWLVTHSVQRDAEIYQLYCANVPAIWSHMAGDSLCSNVMLKYINCTVLTWQPYGVT